jgi:hypothetical protein
MRTRALRSCGKPWSNPVPSSSHQDQALGRVGTPIPHLAELPAKLKALDEAGYAFAFVDTPPAITEAIERERSRGRNRLGRREERIESTKACERLFVLLFFLCNFVS